MARIGRDLFFDPRLSASGRLSSRKSRGVVPWPAKSNMPVIGPAAASNEPPPRRRPPSQLSSMKRSTDDCVIGVWST